jgi:hypothetical protein
MLNARLVLPDDLAWCEGQPTWQTVKAVLGLAEPPPSPSPPPSAAAQLTSEDRLREKMRKKTTLSGVGGWLMFFCVSLIILSPLYSMSRLTSAYEKAQPALERFPTLKAAVQFETAGVVALLIYGIIVGCIIFSGSPSGRRIARQFLLIRLFGFIGIEAVAFWMISQVSPAALSAGAENAVTGIAREFIPFIIWWLYFKRSKRVRNTYGPEST